MKQEAAEGKDHWLTEDIGLLSEVGDKCMYLTLEYNLPHQFPVVTCGVTSYLKHNLLQMPCLDLQVHRVKVHRVKHAIFEVSST